MTILYLILCFFILMSPLLFWMYIFQSFPHLGIGRRQFLLGIGIGMLSTIPLVYSDMFILGYLVDTLFFSLTYITESFLGLSMFFYLSIIFITLGCIIYIISRFCNVSELRMYVTSIIGYMILVLFFCITLYMLQVVIGISSQGRIVESGNYIFQGIVMISGYYILISLLEEGLKYIGNIHISSYKGEKRFFHIIAYAAVIGLGFSFFENILYAYNYYRIGNEISGVLQLLFFRSIFTVALHILCAIILASALYIFSIYYNAKDKHILLFFGLGVLAIISHAIFDIALTYQYTLIIFLYLFGLYIATIYITQSE